MIHGAAFQEWFAGSRIVDGAGEPLLLLHGTPTKFEKFEDSFSTRGPFGRGFYFTNRRDLAEQYARGAAPVAAYIRLLHPYVIDLALPYAKRLEARAVFRDITATETLKARGHDGVLITDSTDGNYIEVVAFFASSIRILKP